MLRDDGQGCARRSGEQHTRGDPEGGRAAVRRARRLRRVEPAGQRGRGPGQQRRRRLPLRHQDRPGARDRAEAPRVDRAAARADGGRHRRLDRAARLDHVPGVLADRAPRPARQPDVVRAVRRPGAGRSRLPEDRGQGRARIAVAGRRSSTASPVACPICRWPSSPNATSWCAT